MGSEETRSKIFLPVAGKGMKGPSGHKKQGKHKPIHRQLLSLLNLLNLLFARKGEDKGKNKRHEQGGTKDKRKGRERKEEEEGQ